METGNLWSLEAEAAVLGSILLDAPCLNKVLPILPSKEAFHKAEHKLIYNALLELHARKAPIDAVILRAELEKTNRIEEAGGVEYLTKILDSVPSSANAEYYAREVRDRQHYRDLVESVEQSEKLLTEPLSVDEQIQRFQDIALGLKTTKLRGGCFTVADHIEKIVESMREHRETIKTGFYNIDKLIAGVAPGELCIIGGRPSMGKSSLALGMALNIAKADKSVVFFSLEMPCQALMERAVCSEAEVNLSTVKGEYEQPALIEKLRKEAEKLKKLDLVLHEAGTTPEEIIAFIRLRKKTYGVDVVFVDFLQLMNTGRKPENRVQEISAISRKLKITAVQEQVSIIALSQLNRQVENRDSHWPRLWDLRDSGALEQDSDIVMLLHRKDYYIRNENPDAEGDGTAEVIVAKNRRGRTGIAKMVFLDKFVKFADRAET